MKLQDYSNSLIMKDNIYFSKNKSDISYPAAGNQGCYQIEENSFWFKHRNNCIIETVLKYAKDEVFFDIGGGNGYVSKGLESINIETVLVEPGIQGALNGQKRGLKNILCSTLEDAEFKKESISAAGLFDVVEHIENDHSFLQNLHEYIAPNGKVFISVPAYNFLWSNEDTDGGHYRRYTRSSMNKLLKQVGFDILYSTYIFSVLPVPILLFRTVPSFLGFNKNANDINKNRKEHESSEDGVKGILDYVWKYESKMIRNGKSMPFGGSYFVVASKK